MNTMSVTVVVSAFNEEENLQRAVESVIRAISTVVSAWEIIIVDDGSTDDTAVIGKALVKKYPAVRFISFPENRGLGHGFRAGIEKSTKKYITVFPGDNDMSAQALCDLIGALNGYDLVVSYPRNEKKRSIFRRILSAVYVKLLNSAFGLNLRYFNGPFICRTSYVKKMKLISSGLNIYAEMVIRALMNNASYVQIPFEHIGRSGGRSKALQIRNVYRICSSLLRLYWEFLKKNLFR